MVHIDKLRNQACVALVGAALGTIAGVVTFMLAVFINPPITSYEMFAPMSDRAKRGGVVTIRATYDKSIDCGGVGFITIRGPSGGDRTIVTITLGNKIPGKWTIDRRFHIPHDAEVGETQLQEVLMYDCGPFRTIARSPIARFIVEE